MVDCPALVAFNSRGIVVGVKCGLWSCPTCRQHNSRMWAWRARLQIENDNKTTYYFWTFTLGSAYKTAKAGFRAIPKLWDNIRRAVQKREKGWIYLAFVEGQGRRGNMPHFHVLSNKPAPYRIKDFAVHNGFGYQAKEKPVESIEAAGYVSKYVSKGMPDAPRNFRRCRPSQKWAKLPPYEGDPLLVKSRKESLTDYLLRVNQASGVDIDELYNRWRTATDEEW